jgi:hypothetical protein
MSHKLHLVILLGIVFFLIETATAQAQSDETIFIPLITLPSAPTGDDAIAQAEADYGRLARLMEEKMSVSEDGIIVVAPLSEDEIGDEADKYEYLKAKIDEINQSISVDELDVQQFLEPGVFATTLLLHTIEIEPPDNGDEASLAWTNYIYFQAPCCHSGQSSWYWRAILERWTGFNWVYVADRWGRSPDGWHYFWVRPGTWRVRVYKVGWTPGHYQQCGGNQTFHLWSWPHRTVQCPR